MLRLRRIITALAPAGALLAGALLPGGGAVAAGRLPDFFGIGRNSLGEACVAQFDNKDAALAEPVFDQSYSLSCRSSVASRKVGTIRRVDNRPAIVAAVETTLECGAPQSVRLAKVGEARARRCFDKSLGSPTIVVDFVRRGTAYYGSASLSLAGPLEQGLAIASGAIAASDADLAQIKPSFPTDTLVASAAAEVVEAGDLFNAENALRQGIRLNQQGLHNDASRQLNDAISRLPADGSTALRGQLELEAALADSNIGFFKTADAHFARANELMVGAGNPLLRRKTASYEALHEINRREFRTALSKLDMLVSETAGTGSPLRDPVILAGVNQPGRDRGSANVSSLGADDTAALQQRIVDAVVDWARSTAHLALGNVGEAQARIDQARRSFAVVKESRIDVSQSLWLEARIERQAGRISARRGQWPAAIASFDRAILVLRDAQLRNPGLGSGEIGAAQLERADILARQGAPRDLVLQEFAAALDSAAATAGGVDPASIERYLDLLANGTDGNTDPVFAERFFRAIQMVSNPSLARQVAQLQSVVSTDPALASQFRERSDLAKELNALRFEIARAPAAEVGALDTQRARLEQRFQELDDLLAANSKFRATDDTPATIADVRKMLRDGEAFFKFSTMKRGAYGIVVTREDALVYRAPSAPAKLAKMAAQLRESILPRIVNGRGTIPAFKVGLSYQLFSAVAGVAADRLAKSTRLVVDPSGPLEMVPIGVLVVDGDSVERFVAAPRPKIGGYENLAFLAGGSEVSTALSPRSFLVARSQPASRAPRPFIGFGQHVLPTSAMLNAFRAYRTRTDCVVDGQTLDESYNYPGLQPISSAELTIAANALGDRQSPIVTGEAFSDKEVMARTDLAQYGVLHFATHGFVEGNWLFCAKSPPSLLTSLAPGESDGILSIDEIAALDLDANLVFLAACDTAASVEDEELARASGLEEAGGSLEGLVRAFLTANARAVVATSWVAPDTDATLDLVRRFYEKGRTSDIGAALREGQVALMRDPASSHPYRWGSFFVVGDASKPLISVATAAGGGAAPEPLAR